MAEYFPTNSIFKLCDEMLVPDGGTVYNQTGPREHVRKFLVVVRVKGLSDTNVAACPGLPRRGSLYITPYSYDLLAVLKTVKAEPQYKDDWQNWVVTCTYSTESGRNEPDTDHPELERPKVSWTEETMQYANWFKDRRGTPIQASSKLPFSPPLTFPISYPVLNIVRKELDYKVEKGEIYSYALNIDKFLNYPKGCVQCMPPHAEQAWKGNYRYWVVTYKIRFAPILWLEKVPKIVLRFPMSDSGTPTDDGGYPAKDYGSTDLDSMPPGSVKGDETKPDGSPPPAGSPTRSGGGGILGDPDLEGNPPDAPPWLVKRPVDPKDTDPLKDNYYYLGWQPLILDRSNYRLPLWPPEDQPGILGPVPQEVAAGIPIPITRAGHPISHPDLLNGFGQPVKKDATGFRNPVYLGFIIYRYLSFKDLLVKGLGG